MVLYVLICFCLLNVAMLAVGDIHNSGFVKFFIILEERAAHRAFINCLS